MENGFIAAQDQHRPQASHFSTIGQSSESHQLYKKGM